MLAVLLDPENLRDEAAVQRICAQIAVGRPDFMFVGGSTFNSSTAPLAGRLKELTSGIPVVLFPGHPAQFTSEADAVLFLSLISGDNPEALIGWQVESARTVRDSGIEALPMGYILVGNGSASATARVTHTTAIPEEDVRRVTDTAIAGELLGMRLIYLEAGSGAGKPVSEKLVKAVRNEIGCPLIVGGGIHTPSQVAAAWKAGADIVVVGNHLEQHPEDLPALCAQRNIN